MEIEIETEVFPSIGNELIPNQEQESNWPVAKIFLSMAKEFRTEEKVKGLKDKTRRKRNVFVETLFKLTFVHRFELENM